MQTLIIDTSILRQRRVKGQVADMLTAITVGPLVALPGAMVAPSATAGSRLLSMGASNFRKQAIRYHKKC